MYIIEHWTMEMDEGDDELQELENRFMDLNLEGLLLIIFI